MIFFILLNKKGQHRRTQIKGIINTYKKTKNFTDLLSKLSLGDIEIINSIEYDKCESILLKKFIKVYAFENLDFEILKNNWNKIVKLGKDSSSLESHIIRYGEVEGKKRFYEKNRKCIRNKQDYIDMYGEEETVKLLSKRGASIKNYIERHGVELGTIKWEEYVKKRKNTYYKRRGTYQKHDLAWYQDKHGIEKGYEIWDNKRKAQAYKVSTAYFIDLYGEEEGKQKIKEKKSRGLSFYIKKYGEEIGIDKYKKMISNRTVSKFPGYSKWALSVILELKNTITDLYYFGPNEIIWKLTENEILAMDSKYKRYIKPDLFYNGKVIEFNGDLFHANPKVFMPNDCPNPFKKEKTAQEIWDNDAKKIEYYGSKGYDILVVWESDYKKNPEEVIKKCLIFLK